VEIASSMVGGSWRTRRGPYLVFQVVLMSAFVYRRPSGRIIREISQCSKCNCATHKF
jgi:hypothetical protein